MNEIKELKGKRYKKRSLEYRFNLEIFELDGDKIYNVKNVPIRFFKDASKTIINKFK